MKYTIEEIKRIEFLSQVSHDIQDAELNGYNGKEVHTIKKDCA